MAPDTSGYLGLLGSSRNNFLYKWNSLFDQDAKEWIAFKPALGLHVYPCYSCRHMFYSKKSFQDHINRRAIVIKYKCPDCQSQASDLTFYNRCSFHLHCRKHYSLEKGTINLSNLEISQLPMGLAGFSKHPDIPYLFDVEEEYITGNTIMNAQFYAPKLEDRGKELITLTPSHLVINRSDQNGENQSLALKQVALNIPKCQFINLQTLKDLGTQMQAQDEDTDLSSEVKLESDNTTEDSQRNTGTALSRNKARRTKIVQISFSDESLQDVSQSSNRRDSISTTHNGPSVNCIVLQPNIQNGTHSSSEYTPEPALDESSLPSLPVITKIETVDESLFPDSAKDNFTRKCSECGLLFGEPLKHHFLGDNRPSFEALRCSSCRLICPTGCSFRAHIRIHDRQPPFTCPDCGEIFPGADILANHMEEVCYHSAKSVRFRCPGRRCGKIFASEATFGLHFRQLHIETLYQCAVCKEIFTGLHAWEIHNGSSHDNGATMIKFFSCPSCGNDEMTAEELQNHIDFHCKDLTRCLYIFMCKFCKCYFRSVATMATHLQNCKVQKTGVSRRSRPSTKPSHKSSFMNSKYISGECKGCKNRIICLKSRPTNYCNKCAPRPMSPPKKLTAPPPEKCICILCKRQIGFDERRQHQLDCKYAQPQVYVEKLDVENGDDVSIQLNQSFSSNSEFDASSDSSPRKIRSESSDDTRPKKRHKTSKPKRTETVNDLTAEEPILFNGTYQCRLCYHKCSERQVFHEHIRKHRHISTAYQCMECGECFVVKPSLVKHLQHYHNISNTEQYFQDNDCFDHGAITELAKVVKAPFLAKTVKANQCRVCMEQFDSSEKHDQHFRIHGMAFLMKNSI